MSKPICVISEQDFVASIADALQYIAVYHPPSFVRALADSYVAEDSPAARDAIAQILINSKMAAYGRRPRSPQGDDADAVHDHCRHEIPQWRIVHRGHL